MKDIPCPKPFSEGCTIVDPNGDTQTCPNWNKEKDMCSWNITKLVEARQFLENSDDTSKELRFSALRSAVKQILEYLEEAEV